MELITILSTIILVATISTFLLAVGAYILYKVREKKFKEVYVKPPEQVQGELIVPASEKEEFLRPVYVNTQKTYIQRENPVKEEYVKSEKIFRHPREVEKKNSESKTRAKFFKYTSEGYVPPEEDNKTKDLKWR